MIQCPNCGGSGRILTDQPKHRSRKCFTCDGTGRVKVTGEK